MSGSEMISDLDASGEIRVMSVGGYSSV